MTGTLTGVLSVILIQQLILQKTTNHLLPTASSPSIANSSSTATSPTLLRSNIVNDSVEDDMPIFDFYTELSHAKGPSLNNTPNKIIPITAPVIQKKPQPTASSPTTKLPLTPTTKQTNQVNSLPNYLVQAASLKDSSAALKFKKKIALWGLASQISKSTNDKGATWYRIQIGPYNTAKKATDALNLLALHGVKGMLIKQ